MVEKWAEKWVLSRAEMLVALMVAWKVWQSVGMKAAKLVLMTVGWMVGQMVATTAGWMVLKKVDKSVLR